MFSNCKRKKRNRLHSQWIHNHVCASKQPPSVNTRQRKQTGSTVQTHTLVNGTGGSRGEIPMQRVSSSWRREQRLQHGAEHPYLRAAYTGEVIFKHIRSALLIIRSPTFGNHITHIITPPHSQIISYLEGPNPFLGVARRFPSALVACGSYHCPDTVMR